MRGSVSGMATKAATMAAEWWAERLQQGDKEVFKETLAALVDSDIQKYGHCKLECDYDPIGHLLTSVRAAGVNCRGCLYSAEGILPEKHRLRVDPNMLEHIEGYRNWTEAIKVPNG